MVKRERSEEVKKEPIGETKESMATLFQSPKRWLEDAELENGNYINKCSICGHDFIGYKRRVICRECTPNWTELAKKQPPEDCKNNQAWHGAWLDGEMTGYARCMVEKVLVSKDSQSEIESLRENKEIYKKGFQEA